MKTNSEHNGVRFKVVPNDILTPRESETLVWIAEGKTSEEGGMLMGIAPSSSEEYRKRLRKKMQVTNLPELVAVSFRERLLHPIYSILLWGLIFLQVAQDATVNTMTVSRAPSRPARTRRVGRSRTGRTGRRFEDVFVIQTIA